MTAGFSERIELAGADPLVVFGSGDQNLRAMQEVLPVRAVLREGAIVVMGEEAGAVGAARQLLTHMVDKARAGGAVDVQDVRLWAQAGQSATSGAVSTEIDLATHRVTPRSAGQARYVDAMQRHDVVFGIGPAGTGKTFLAVAMAVAALHAHDVERILLVRPAVEAGESLGFLPGDYREKVDPYLRPLYDALGALMTQERMRKLVELGVIEVAPLAYMRGRTLHRAFVILDEAQNTTLGQMKMFLTRLGPESKAVITGDVTQIDLPHPEDSGLVRIQPILMDIERVSFVRLDREDVVRHRLVRDIIEAFESHTGGDEGA